MADEFLSRLHDGAEFSHLELQDADLSDTTAWNMGIRNCLFTHVDLTGADWGKLKCSATKFINCRFLDANLENASFENCSFFDPDLSASGNFLRANLRSAAFTKCDLSGCIFEGANLSRVVIRESNATGAKFFRARFNGSAQIVKNKLRYADLRGADLSKCDLSENDLVYAVLDEANFTQANLMGSDLGGVSARYAKFAGADLRGAILTAFDLRTMDLQGAKIFESQMRRLLENAEIIIFPDAHD